MEADNYIKSDEKLISILEAIRDINGGTLTEIADYTSIHKSTVYTHLATLRSAGYIVKENGRYDLGIRFLNLGMYAKFRKPEYSEVVVAVEQLAVQTEQRVQFIIEEHGKGHYLHYEERGYTPQTDVQIGHTIPLHTTAAGKAILAAYSESRVNGIIEEHGLERMTENTLTTRENLDKELNLIRENGYSFNDEEHVEGLQGYGCTINLPDGGVLGGLSVTSPQKSMDSKDNKYLNSLMNIANMLEVKLVENEK